ncbi:MAG: GGDEF domain-containing protein [Ruminococcus sp.]|nr:GGDEF domain-containing protein [Ruminococcus sp.]
MKNKSFITLPKWHRLLLKAMAVGMLCFFVFAVLLYILYDPGVSFDRKLYVRQFIIIPTVSQIIIVSIFALAVKFLEKHVSDWIMTTILSVCITSYLGVMVSIHNSVPEMSILLIYPIFGATIYNSRHIMIMQCIITMSVYFVIKSFIIPIVTVYEPVNTNRTYFIIFIGLTLGAVIISFLLRSVSTEIVKKSIKEKEKLEFAARCDQMTGFFNHRTFYELLNEKIKEYDGNSRFSLIVLDIDNFKRVNDRFGHASGDKIILKAVDIIKENIRSSDSAFRYGGEEFAVIISDAGEDTAAKIAVRIVNSFYNRKNGFEFNNEKFSISAGTAEYSGGSAEEFFNRADAALYYAKNHGKNQCVKYSEFVLKEA